MHQSNTENSQSKTKETASKNIILFDDVKKIATSIVILYGILTVFSYCFFTINFYPSGLSAGDILFFLFIALGIGFMALIASVIGSFAFLPVLIFGEKENSKIRSLVFLASPILLIVICAIPTVFFKKGWNSKTENVIAYWIFFAVLFSSVILALAYYSNRKNSERPRIPIEFYSFIVVLLGYFVVAAIAYYALILLGKKGLLFASLITIAGLSLILWASLIDSKKKINIIEEVDSSFERRRKIVMIVFFTAFMSPSLILPEARNVAFNQLGIRSINASVLLDKKNLEAISSAAAAAGISISLCKGSQGDAVVAPVDVLWHGMGSKTWVELQGTKDGISRFVRTELMTDGVKLIRGGIERCVDVEEGALFQSGSSQFKVNDGRSAQVILEAILKPHIESINKNWILKEVIVEGHSDPMPLPNDGNDSLARLRAESIKKILPSLKIINNKMEVSKPDIIAKSVGTRKQVKQCDSNQPKDVQRDCNSVNRRVELRFKWEAPLLDPDKPFLGQW